MDVAVKTGTSTGMGGADGLVDFAVLTREALLLLEM